MPWGGEYVSAMLDRRISRLLLGLFLILVAGTLGFILIEGADWFDALYMTATTITTVGFQEVWDLHPAGRIWAMWVMFTGVGMFFYIASEIAVHTVEFRRIRRYRMQQKIARLRDHYIICGYGRMGSAIAEELVLHGISFVVIENGESHLERLQEKGFLYIAGDATLDENLLGAGIERATGLIGVLRDDPDNLFLTISARSLNSQLSIITRAGSQESIPKMKKVGANKVINPYVEAGKKLARQAISPDIVEFMDIVLSHKNLDLVLESVEVKEGSELMDQSMVDLDIRKRFNISIAAVVRRDGTPLINPDPSYRFREGDRLIALGNAGSLVAFTNLCSEEQG